jgi:prepilin-type N-terminal cleavage/methylation domain-containing protein
MKTHATQRGMTLLEVIAAVVIMSIMFALVATGMYDEGPIRTVSTASQIRQHIRYAQSMAMKYGDDPGDPTDPINIYGLHFRDTTSYFIFTETVAPDNTTAIAPDTTATKVQIPGENGTTFDISDVGGDTNLSINAAFTVMFDTFGRPYTAYTNPTAGSNTPVATDNTLTFTVQHAGKEAGDEMTFEIEPETGFIEVQ